MLKLKFTLLVLVACSPFKQGKNALKTAPQQDIMFHPQQKLELVEHNFFNYHISNQLGMLYTKPIENFVQDR